MAPIDAINERDHPRGCGEKGFPPIRAGDSPGSSPRVRGEEILEQDLRLRRGIIPAGAGRSSASFLKYSSFRDHPRGCGEKSESLPCLLRRRGSSPRVRGEVSETSARSSSPGIIPAGAGRREGVGGLACLFGDHPRGCGEKYPASTSSCPRRGSSPRVRGEGGLPPAAAHERGIIPAGAGRSVIIVRRALIARDHPRGCGEKPDGVTHLDSSLGSSPRVRGEVSFGFLLFALSGIIPAGAGRSAPGSSPPFVPRDHPRGCGEKVCEADGVEHQLGSSPRVRGEGTVLLKVALGRGIIPAGAGRRWSGAKGRGRDGDHPRGCGEKVSIPLDVLMLWGSSPRVRGEDDGGGDEGGVKGIIPAGAGRSSAEPGLRARYWDHPRGCGEKVRDLSRRK